MKRFKTELEQVLWEMLHRSQMALSIMCLDDANRTMEDENQWPAGQKWNEINVSSKAIFAREARVKAGINHNEYLKILRGNEDAMETAKAISDEFDEPWDSEK